MKKEKKKSMRIDIRPGPATESQKRAWGIFWQRVLAQAK